MPTTKYLKINDSIADPTGGVAVIGICAQIASPQFMDGILEDNIAKFPVVANIKYYRSEADLIASKQQLLWNNLISRVVFKLNKSSVTAGDSIAAIYSALKTQIFTETIPNGGLGYVNVAEILE